VKLVNVWGLNPRHIESPQGTDEGPFRDFVNRLIHVHAAVSGIPSSPIATDSKNMKDGGVDNQVWDITPEDLPSWVKEFQVVDLQKGFNELRPVLGSLGQKLQLDKTREGFVFLLVIGGLLWLWSKAED